MNYGNIKYFDIADGVGVRTTLFVSGCTHHCRECFQPETWDFDFGKEFTTVEEDEIIESLKGEFVEGLTLLGGEPFEPSNQKALLPFAFQKTRHNRIGRFPAHKRVAQPKASSDKSPVPTTRPFT